MESFNFKKNQNENPYWGKLSEEQKKIVESKTAHLSGYPHTQKEAQFRIMENEFGIDDIPQKDRIECYKKYILEAVEGEPEEEVEKILNIIEGEGVFTKKESRVLILDEEIRQKSKITTSTEKDKPKNEEFTQSFSDSIKPVESLPEEKKEKEIIKILENKYDAENIQTLESSADFTDKIMEKEILRDEQAVKEIEIVMERDKDRLPISPEIILPEKKSDKEKKEKLKNYLTELATRYHNGLKVPREAIRWAKKAAIILGIAGAGLAVAFGINEITSKYFEKEEIKNEAEKTPERLSENCKKVVEYFKENNPTPGKWFIVTDKDSAKNFIFDEKCELQKVVKIGLGKTKGEENNTSYQLHQGNMTTPAGVYIMTNVNNPSDEKYYSKLITLYGISIKGDKVILGMHEYYAGERKMRIKAINNPDNTERVKTARVTDGCENSSEKDMNFILENFKIEDKSELLVILPDDGISIDLDKIMPEILKVQKEWQAQMKK